MFSSKVPGISMLLLLLVGLASAHMILVQDAQAVGGWRGQDQFRIAMSWCAINGSPAASNPNVPNPWGTIDRTTDDVLWRRHERATDNVFINQAGITLRSGINDAIHNNFDFPRINDPNTAMGQQGDIRGENLNVEATEFNQMIRDCRAWWTNEAARTTGVVNGLTAVNLRLYHDGSGNTANVIGWGGCAQSPTTGICNFPYQGRVAIVDNFFTLPGISSGQWNNDPVDQLLAHEVGHALGLAANTPGYVNGHNTNSPSLMFWQQFDNDGDGMVDNTALNNDEVTRVRSSAPNVPGTERDPPQEIIPGDTIMSQRVDEVQESIIDEAQQNRTLPPHLDISSVTVAFDKENNRVSFGQELFGVIPERMQTEAKYFTLADLDNNKATGAAEETLAEIGIPSRFVGADLITQANVQGQNTTEGTGWLVQDDGSLFEIPAEQIEFDIQSMVMYPYYAIGGPGEDGATVSNIINAIIDNRALGIIEPEQSINVQAIAIEEGMQQVDKLDDTEEGAKFVLTQPPFPQCFPEADARAGDSVLIRTEGLIPDSPIHGLLGPREVFKGITDSEGGGIIEFPIPANTTEGLHLVTIGIDDTALTADCEVNVIAADDDDIDGAPPSDFEIDVEPKDPQVTQGFNTTLRATATLTNGDTQPVDLDVTGLPEGATAEWRCPEQLREFNENAPCLYPTDTAELIISTETSTPSGHYPLTITAKGMFATHSVNVDLMVNTLIR